MFQKLGSWFRELFHRMGEGLRRFMVGRYGTDALNRVLLIAALVLIVVGWLGSRLTPLLGLCNVLAYVPLIWSIVRSWSKNIEARRRENAAWMRLRTRLQDREHRYYSCPRCRQSVRVPRGRGRISIRCPKCGERFIKKT